MKLLLSFIFLFIYAFNTKAQNAEIERERMTDNAIHKDAIQLQIDRVEKDSGEAISTKPFYLLNPKAGVHFLLQDNMPCIVPDPSATVVIPNGWVGETKIPFKSASPSIPNGRKRLNITPSRPLLTYPKSK